jgi:hypothetical protein
MIIELANSWKILSERGQGAAAEMNFCSLSPLVEVGQSDLDIGN